MLTVSAALDRSGCSSEERAAILASLVGFKEDDPADAAFINVNVVSDVNLSNVKLRGYLRTAQAVARVGWPQPGATRFLHGCVPALCCILPAQLRA